MFKRLKRAVALLRPRAITQMALQLQHLDSRAEELRRDTDDLRRRTKHDASRVLERHERFERHTTAQLERITRSIEALTRSLAAVQEALRLVTPRTEQLAAIHTQEASQQRHLGTLPSAQEKHVELQLNNGKQGITIDPAKIVRVQYDAPSGEEVQPRGAHLRIDVNEGDSLKRHILKGRYAEAAWRTLVPSVRSDDASRAMGSIASGVDRVTRNVDALMRFMYTDRLDMPYPQKLVAKRARFLSNDEDDGITLTLLAEIGVKHHRFVEVACGTNGGNSGFLALECGWRGLMIDADGERLAAAQRLFRYADVAFAQSFVTRDNINRLLEEHDVRDEIDLLSVDIDGNDYWLWDAVTVITPRLVIIEYNSYFGPEKSFVVPYDPEFDRHKYTNYYYGASIQAMTKLAVRKGYRNWLAR